MMTFARLFVALMATLSIASCGGGGGGDGGDGGGGGAQILPPLISSFQASAPIVTGGDSSDLTPVFQNGSGSIDHGVGSVVSGTNYSVTPTSTTIYTLTVRNSEGAIASQQVEIQVVAAPSITSFTSASSTITEGDSTTITALFSDGEAEVDNGVGVVTSGESISVSPTVDTTYTVAVTNAAGTQVSQQVTINVVRPPGITSFNASPSSILSGQSATLTAVFNGGTGTIDNGVGVVTSGIDSMVSPLVDTTYTLTVTNEAGMAVTSQVAVTVTNVPPPSISSFSASDDSISVGESLALTAVFSNGNGVIDNGVGPVTSGAPVAVGPATSTTYELTVTNAASVQATAQVFVTVVPPPTVSSFTASESIITEGDATSLTAVFSDGDASINNGVGPVTSGMPVTVSPTVSTTYVLTVTNSADTSVTRQETIIVVPPPSIAAFTAGANSIPKGQATQITPTFSGGTGTIDNGIGAVTSGVPVNVSPSMTTTYRLVVTNAAGTSVLRDLEIVVSAAFKVTQGSLATGRAYQTATLLSDSRVLLVGGYSPVTPTAELYDPATETFSSTGSMSSQRFLHTATRLPDGRVLIAGGAGNSPLNSAEIYDPTTGQFSPTGNLLAARHSHTAVLLPSGKVLITGGSDNSAYLSSSEIYDPSSGTFSAAASLNIGRRNHTATLLSNGLVLIAGGANPSEGSAVGTSEVYDYAADSYTATVSLATPRHSHKATRLADSRILITGGYDGSYLSSAEIYDPVTGFFSAAGNMTTPRDFHTSTLLPSGKVLLTGGNGSGSGQILRSAELYDPVTATFSATADMNELRYTHSATLLPNGQILIAGGNDGNTTGLTSAEVYEPKPLYQETFSGTGSLSQARYRHTSTRLPDGRILITGGKDQAPGSLDSAEIFDSVTGTYSDVGPMTLGRLDHRAVVLPNGKVLIVGGHAGFGYTSSAELFDPVAETFTSAGNMTAARANASVNLLPDGTVLIAGGYDSGGGGGPLASAEVYDPVSGTFTSTSSLATARQYHSGTLMPNGKVLIAGGHSFGNTFLSSAEVYDPQSGIFSATNDMISVRRIHTATLLPTGLVLIVGGDNFGSLATAELYDPLAGTFTATGSLSSARHAHSAVLLPNGMVLVLGGFDTVSNSSLSSAEYFDPIGGNFTSAGSLATARYHIGAAMLPDSRILVSGGSEFTPTTITYLATSEVYE